MLATTTLSVLALRASHPVFMPRAAVTAQRCGFARASYYEVIDGLKYDGGCIEAAKEAVAGKGDGRVSKSDAEKILATLLDGPVGKAGNSITEIEYRTAFRVLHDYKWTAEAQAMFIERLAKV